MDNKKRLLSLIGLATRARKVVSGEFSTEKSVKSGRSCLVIVSEEASANTRKMFTNMCTYYKVPVYFYSDKETLGAAMGKMYRASVAVTDEGLGKAIENRLREAGCEVAEEEKENGGSKYGKNQSK